MAQMPTKAAADSVKEKRMKFLISNLQFELVKVLSSVILVDKYPSTTLVFNFSIVEMDADVLQSMINCAAIALYNSEIECRCLPIAITLLISPERKGKDPNWF